MATVQNYNNSIDQADQALILELQHEHTVERSQRVEETQKRDTSSPAQSLSKLPVQGNGKRLGSSKPNLPAPESPEAQYKQEEAALGGDDQTSIIAIIGAVLALQAKSNSNFWSTMWEQATASMNLSIALAPTIANAVKDNWNAQAQATEQEANQATGDGWFAVGATTLSVLMGGYGAWKAGGEEAAGAADDAGLTKTPNDAASSSTLASADAENQLNQAVKETDTTTTGQIKRWGLGVKANLGKGTKGLFTALEKTAGYGQAFMASSQGMAQLTIDAPAKTEIAIQQRAAGAADALSKVSEQYSQYYNQNFSREEDLRQGSSQNIDFILNVLKSASDQVTQVSIGMFRG